jgi:hypothetical protein
VICASLDGAVQFPGELKVIDPDLSLLEVFLEKVFLSVMVLSYSL